MDKRETLVKTAFKLFYEHGIHAVGINQVLQEAGVAKKTLYHHFSSKEQLIEAALVYRDETFSDWLAGKMQSESGAEKAVDAAFDALDDWFNDNVADFLSFSGCFFINASAEFAPHTHPVHIASAAHKERVVKLFKQALRDSGLGEECLDELAAELALLKEGAIVQAYVQGDTGAAQRAKRIANRLLAQALSAR